MFPSSHVPPEVELLGDRVAIMRQGSVDAVVKAARELEVIRIVTHDADLEDTFLAYTVVCWPTVRGQSSFDEVVRELPDALRS